MNRCDDNNWDDWETYDLSTPVPTLEDLQEFRVEARSTYRNGVLPAPVRDLRKTSHGRKILREHGRTDKRARNSADGLRPFVFWDGEGVSTLPPVRWHDYILFGCSLGDSIQGVSLSTLDCLDLMLDVEKRNPDVIHVGFAFKYDAEMICRDVPRKFMQRMLSKRVVHWRGYRLEYLPGKWFQVSRNKTVCRIWDVFGFFQQSFVSTLRNLFGKLPAFDEIASGKDDRNGFRYEDLESKIKPYWKSELEWGVKLVERLRRLLYEADLCITQWHGPGAIANHLFTKNGVKRHKNDNIQRQISDAARYAFTAGRFEPFRIGRANCKIYAYDINSAHPTGMAELPSLTGEWRRVERPGDVSDVGIYRVTFDAFAGTEPLYDRRLTYPQPLPHRDSKMLVSYPCQVSTWIWASELRALQRYGVCTGELLIHEGWELEYDPDDKPFRFIYDLYEKRQHYKSIGEAVQIAYKLGLNSLFGKTAQRVGWNEETGKIPQWHQLEWAGMITANTRALLWEGIMQAAKKGSLVSVDTDAVYSTEPLDLPCGAGLGKWEYEVLDDLVYLQNGIYFKLENGEWKQKFRGLDPDSLSIDDALRWFDSNSLYVPNPYTQFAAGRSGMRDPMLDRWHGLQIEGRTTRFVGSKAAFAGDEARRCRWETEPRVVHLGTKGKRVHYWERCDSCLKGQHYGSEGFHDLTLPTHRPLDGIESNQHFIPWAMMGENPWRDKQDEMFYT